MEVMGEDAAAVFFYPPTRADPITSFRVIEEEGPTLRPCCALTAKQSLITLHYCMDWDKPKINQNLMTWPLNDVRLASRLPRTKTFCKQELFTL